MNERNGWLMLRKSNNFRKRSELNCLRGEYSVGILPENWDMTDREISIIIIPRPIAVLFYFKVYCSACLNSYHTIYHDVRF